MIKEAILAHPEAARIGLSRPVLKKYINAKHPTTTSISPTAFSSALSRAILKGAEKKVLVLPKGPAGKVKLAPAAKKVTQTTTKKVTKKPKGTKPKAAKPTAKATLKDAKPKVTKKPATTTKKASSTTKKGPATKKAPIATTTAAAAAASKKATTKAPAKKATTTTAAKK